MNDSEIDSKLKNLLTKIFEINHIDLNSSMDDIPEWDSINHVLLIQQIEEDFEISIDVTDAIDIEDVFDIISTLKKYNIS